MKLIIIIDIGDGGDVSSYRFQVNLNIVQLVEDSNL